jgi:hypothetical protein
MSSNKSSIRIYIKSKYFQKFGITEGIRMIQREGFDTYTGSSSLLDIKDCGTNRECLHIFNVLNNGCVLKRIASGTTGISTESTESSDTLECDGHNELSFEIPHWELYWKFRDSIFFMGSEVGSLFFELDVLKIVRSQEAVCKRWKEVYHCC